MPTSGCHVKEKTKLMIFNPARSVDFCPSFSLNDNELETVEETKLLGLIVDSKLGGMPLPGMLLGM